ncbi:MAG: suppressor of fused domain protein [Planctomycetota bacterium]
MSIGNPQLIKQRESHYTRFLGPLDQKIMHSTDHKEVHVDIYTFAPNVDRDWYTLITGGMSDVRQAVPDDWDISPRAEIMLYCHQPERWMYNSLKNLAEMPTDDDVFLSYRHTVPNGMPMTAKPSLLTSYLFYYPLFEIEEFSPMVVDGDGVDILLLLPITEGEREFAMQNSVWISLWNDFRADSTPLLMRVELASFQESRLQVNSRRIL